MHEIAMLGGDERQKYLAMRLKDRGFAVVGFGNQVRPAAKDLASAVKNAGAVILPVPSTRDGKYLSQADREMPRIAFSELLSLLAPGTLLSGGMMPPEWCAAASARGILPIDYFSGEPVQLQNALPTVEGALRLAMQALPVTLCGTQTAVVGYGRIGSLLVEKLVALGASVGVLARSPVALAAAELHGARAQAFQKGVPPFFADCRVLFNTVPERVLDASFLSALPKNCVLIELASAPGGFDPDLAKASGLTVIPAQGLPGRFYPETAGKILADAVCELFAANGFSD